MVEFSEPVDVWAFFKKGEFQPHIFFWKGRRIQIEKVNLVHTTRNGLVDAYHFSVSTSNGNFYRLGFDIEKLKWILEAVEEE